MKEIRVKKHRHRIIVIVLILAATGHPSVVFGQERPDPAALTATQQDAMKRFAKMDGIWRGSAWVMLSSGDKHQLIQTERAGPFLDGSVRVIEGRGYEDDGRLEFNALGIISFDPQTQKYTMRSYAQGQAGDFIITPTEEGFQWEIPAGPMTIRYKAMLGGGTWKEVGDRVSPDGASVRFYEMTLTRVAETDWPAAGTIGPK